LAIHASAWVPGPRQVLDPQSEASAAIDRDLLWPLFPGEPVGRLTVEQRRELCLELPRGVVIATCRLVDALQVAPWYREDASAPMLVDRQRRVVRSVSEAEERLGNYSVGRWAWILADVQPLPVPVLCRGARKLWEWRG
jgi:hypothetical protein